ncbi:MAG: AAA family ATPase [bacterium]|nr:AAA family ATPase [bacterium]MXZ30299.1 ParA family protein [Acidimicrobiia bacterium]MYB24591.1 ParA family protein [Acidimicrobiia bacterium]MYJ12912.1 ParA family protein [Acidimicrobiia bacterium]
MTVPVITFFNNKGGVGKTSLVYHISWMLSEIGERVLACDLDPQANLTAMFLPEDRLESIYGAGAELLGRPETVFECVRPLMEVGDLHTPVLSEVNENLWLIPGDLALAGFEDTLSAEWPNALGSRQLHRPFRILSAFHTVMQQGAEQMEATIILADVGPNLGAINRSAIIATDHVVVPVGADLFSLLGLRNLGPTLRDWRADWRKRLDNWREPAFDLPTGRMAPVGYVVQQHGIRLGRPVQAYDKWVNRMPAEYARSLLGDHDGPYAPTPSQDCHALGTTRHYRSLVPMAQEARKPVFKLTAADGAIGSHAAAADSAYSDFGELARKLLERTACHR